MMSIAPREHEIVTAWRVACDGGEGALGHPRVFHSVSHESGFATCNYCDKLFVHEEFSAKVLADFGLEA